MKEPSTPPLQGREGYIGVDFNNIDINEDAQKTLLDLRKQTTEKEIRRIVYESMMCRAKSEIEVDKKTLLLAVKKRPDNTGYLNTDKKIEEYWRKMADACSDKAIIWLRENH